MRQSLLVATDIHKHQGSSRLAQVLAMVQNDFAAVQPEAVLIGGDHAGGGKPPRAGGNQKEWVPEYSPEDIKNEVQLALGNKPRIFLTYGSHDKNAINGYHGFFSGPADCGGYYIYGISFAQMRYAYRSQMEESGYDGIDLADPYGCCAAEAADSFLRWAAGRPDHNPVFVMSHLPLHLHRQDNLGAEIWCNALNLAALHRPVFAFFGHNHSAERRSAIDQDYYLVPAGGSMPVQCAERQESIELELAFTYLNAGYIINGCATLITLEAGVDTDRFEHITIRRYSITPEDAAFGATGFPMPYIVQIGK